MAKIIFELSSQSALVYFYRISLAAATIIKLALAKKRNFVFI